MAGGVRLATGYISIEAETSKVPQQIKDALQKAGTDAAKSTGTQIGKDLSKGIDEGMDLHKVGTTVGADLSKGLDPKKTGTQVGKDLSKSIRVGMDQATTAGSGGGVGTGLGKQIQTDLNKGLDPKTTGTKIGKDLGTGVKQGSEDSLRDGLKPVRDWATHVKGELKKGDIKGAFGDVGDVVDNVGAAINNLGRIAGVNLDGVEKFGTDIATALDKAGTTAQTTIDDVRNVGAAIKAIGSGDVLGRVQGVSSALAALQTAGLHVGVDISGITGPLQDITGVAGQFAELSSALGGSTAALGGFATAVGLAAAPIAAIAGLAAEGKWFWDLAHWNAQPGAPGTSPGLAPEATIPTVPGQKGLPPLVKPLRPTPRGDFVPAAPPPPPPPGRVAATEIPQPGWTKDPLTGTLYTPDGTPVPAEPGTYARPKPDYWSSKGPPTPQLAPVSVPEPAAGPRAIPGLAEATAGVANIHANTASISVGSATISGVSVPVPGTSISSSSSPSFFTHGNPAAKFDEGGPVTADQLAKLHAGEHVLDAGDVHAMGGQGAVADFRAQLAGTGNAPPGGLEAAGQAHQGAADALDAMRTAGFVPAAAGQQTVAGTSFVASLLNMGNEAVGGAIDAAAQAASMAASLGTFGAGGAAANVGIQMGATEAKRAASYGFQMASIGADALIEQLFPFGAPRWIGYDYTKFAPHINVGSIATTTVEKAMAAQMGKAGGLPSQQPGGPVQPGQLPGEQPPGPPLPKFGTPPTKVPAPEENVPGRAPAGTEPGGPGAVQAGITAGLGAAPGAGAPTLQAPPPPPVSTSPAPPPPQQGGGVNPLAFLGMDEGGWLMPGQPALNSTGRPELVLSPQQLDAAMGSGSKNPWSHGGDTYHFSGLDADDVGREIDKRKKLAMIQYGSRP